MEKRHGKWQKYLENGKIAWKMEKLPGKWKICLEYGKIAWKMVKLLGKWQKYLENGKMLSKENGKMVRKWQKCMENGKSTWKMARVSRPNVGLKQRLVSNLKCRTFSDVQMFLLVTLFSFSSICF